MMVELLSAAIASEAVMTVALHLAVAQHAECQLIIFKSLWGLFIRDQAIDWVKGGELNVVIGDDDDKSIVESEQHPQYLFLDVVESWHYEDRMECELYDEYDKRGYLFRGGGSGIGVDWLVRPYPLGARYELFFGAVLETHVNSLSKISSDNNYQPTPTKSSNQIPNRYYFVNYIDYAFDQYTIVYRSVQFISFYQSMYQLLPINYMGNQAGCSRICNKTAIVEYNPDDILVTQYTLLCQICNQSYPHNHMKHHIDIAHYASINQHHNGALMLQCLLCHTLTPDLLSHSQHTADKHPYAAIPTHQQSKPPRIQSKSDNQLVTDHKSYPTVGKEQLNEFKRSGVVRLVRDSEFQIVEQMGDGKYLAAIDGVSYTVERYIKQCGIGEQDGQCVEAELVWFNIFRHSNCRYYYLASQRRQRSIVWVSYIFTERS